jgi:hypothetical protein
MDFSNISFSNIKGLIIFIFIMLIVNYITILKLQDFQFYEMICAIVFIVIFFGVFNLIMTFDMDAINNSILFAVLFGCWYYIVKKLSNAINSDSNGVIKF